MFGSLGSLKPGQQGGGRVAKRRSGNGEEGPALPTGSAARKSARVLTPLEAAIQKNHSQAEAELKGKVQLRDLPEWIVAGQRVGYLSSSGRLCEGLLEYVSLEKSEVKFQFSEDATIWKRVPFSEILGKRNPLRRLSLPSERTTSINEMLNSAIKTNIDKAFMMERVVGFQAVLNSSSGKPAGSEAGNSGSAAPEPGSAPGSCGSRSESPRLSEAKEEDDQLPEWIAVGKRVGYVSKSTGHYCQVDIDSIAEDTVKIIFVDDRKVWKGIPFTMIRSTGNPLRPIVPDENHNQSDDDVVDLSDCASDGSLSPVPGAAKVSSPEKKDRLPRWIVEGQRVGYLSKSSGKVCQVEVETILTEKKEVKIVFVENRAVWKGIPFSMILSSGNPLKPL